MIVKFDIVLIGCLLRSHIHPPRPKPPAFVTVMTENGPQLMKCEKNPCHDAYGAEPSTAQGELAISEMPDWLKEELVRGQVISMESNDYANLPSSVRSFAEVMAY